MDTAIQKAQRKMRHISANQEELRMYQMREMAMSDWTSGINTAMKKGMEKGIEKGIKKGAMQKTVEFVMNARKMKLTVEQIAALTNLTDAEVYDILDKN